MNPVRPVAAFALLWLGGAACQPQETCAMEGAACGGDPNGNWEIVAAGSCRDPVYRPPPPLTLLTQPKGTAREMPPEPTSSDWCSYLTILPSGTVENFQFPYDTLAVGGGSLTYQAGESTYVSRIATQGSGHVDLSGTCLTAFGATPSCPDLQSALIAFAGTLGTVQNIQCGGNAQGGCSCDYVVVFTAAYSGLWRTNGTVMTHFDSLKLLPSQVEYCVAGDRMTMWGRDRASILDVPGVRTLSLVRKP
ncbi:MAG: hypothetical protein ABUS79_11870 [Pseudomonadota bacterium]